MMHQTYEWKNMFSTIIVSLKTLFYFVTFSSFPRQNIRYINFHQRKRFNMHRIYYAVEKAINHVEPASKEVNYLSANIDLVQGLVIGQIYTNCI